jgi:hypothetical protein
VVVFFLGFWVYLGLLFNLLRCCKNEKEETDREKGTESKALGLPIMGSASSIPIESGMGIGRYGNAHITV